MCYEHSRNLSLAKIKDIKPEIRIIVHITSCSVKILDISLSRIELFGTRDTASKFGTVPENSGNTNKQFSLLTYSRPNAQA